MTDTTPNIRADDACFVCGVNNATGLQASFRVDTDRRIATTELVIAARFQGWQEVVHGGIIAALLDEAAIYACRPLSLEAVTAELNVKYRKPVPTGQLIQVEAQVIQVRRRLVHAHSRLLANGQLLAEAQVKVLLLTDPT